MSDPMAERSAPIVGAPGTAKHRTTSTAVLVYVIILISLQIFLITVAIEAFLTGDRSLAWSTAIVSVVLAGFAAVFLRYLRP